MTTPSLNTAQLHQQGDRIRAGDCSVRRCWRSARARLSAALGDVVEQLLC